MSISMNPVGGRHVHGIGVHRNVGLATTGEVDADKGDREAVDLCHKRKR